MFSEASASHSAHGWGVGVGQTPLDADPTSRQTSLDADPPVG